MLRFHVADMTCRGCVKGVTRAIQKVAADAQVEVDLGKRQVSVTGAPDRDAVLQAIKGAGFAASLHS
jgi:copper chaperone